MKEALLKLVSASGMVAWERWRSREALRIVTYHGVDERQDPVVNFDRLQIAPDIFAKQIELLAREYRVIELSTAVRHWLEFGRWPLRALAITFDDGYLNNLNVAAPILKRLGLPATFFVTPAFVDGTERPWWYEARMALKDKYPRAEQAIAEAVRLERCWRPLPHAERAPLLAALRNGQEGSMPYPFMSRADLSELVRLGFDVQPHGERHLSFGGESVDALKNEVERSASFVRDVTGRIPWGLAYPYGHQPSERDAVEAIMRDCGLQVALTTVEGWNGPNTDRWTLCRFDMHGGYSVAATSVRVSGIRGWLASGRTG